MCKHYKEWLFSCTSAKLERCVPCRECMPSVIDFMFIRFCVRTSHRPAFVWRPALLGTNSCKRCSRRHVTPCRNWNHAPALSFDAGFNVFVVGCGGRREKFKPCRSKSERVHMHQERRKLEVNKTFAEETYFCGVSPGMHISSNSGFAGPKQKCGDDRGRRVPQSGFGHPHACGHSGGRTGAGGTVIRIWLW